MIGFPTIRTSFALGWRYVLFSVPLTWVAVFIFVGIEGEWDRLLVWRDLAWAVEAASYGAFLHETLMLHLPLALIVIALGRFTAFSPIWLGVGAAFCELPSWLSLYGTWPGWPHVSAFFLVLGAMQGMLLAWLARRYG